jgi:[ribosomal protein S5]-alanine N-acetyltransferase
MFLDSLLRPDLPARLPASRVYLRPPEVADWAPWAELRAASRDFLTPWEPAWAADELTRASYRRRLRRLQRDARDDLAYAFFLFRRDGDALIGGLTLGNVRRGVTQSCSVGYWIGRPYARKGLMSEGLAAALPFVFEQLRLHRLEAACLPTNIASQGVLGRCGFQREGYARQYLRINGQWSDHLLFALLAEEWRVRSRALRA